MTTAAMGTETIKWAGNLGSFQDPESRLSLEYRLRNTPLIRDAILQLLADLRDSARSALDIVSGKQENRTALPLIDLETDLAEFEVSSGSESSNLSSSGEEYPAVSSASEIEELTSAIRGSINGLFKTSVFIRRFAPKERRQRAAEKTDSYNSQTDEILSSEEQIDTHVDEGLVEYILKSAKKVFALSLICDVEAGALHEAMKIFRSTDFDDGNLPVKFTDSGEPPWSQLQWPGLVAHKFRQRQWIFLVPIFRRGMLNVNLEPHHILPLALASNERLEGRSHNLWEVTVHEAHQEEPMRKYDNSLATAAIKTCENEASYVEVETNERWKQEEEFLNVRKLYHLHIVDMEAIITWAGRGKYLMYKWPDGGNLRDFYASDPRPTLEAGFVCAMAQQLAGLVDALRTLHDMDANRRSLYRHGNLEPEDIWRYEDGSRVGVMKLCDIGWESHHPQGDSTLNRLSYGPPEATSDPDSARSRRYDMWSFGCIILELLIWLVYGTNELESFIRGINGSSNSHSPYWVMEEDGTRRWAQVHPNVRAYMDHIAKDPECSGTHATAIGDLLTIVRTRLLVVSVPSINVPRSQGRAGSRELFDSIRGMLEKGRSNSEYWYTGVPRDGLSGPAELISPL
ncbi:hypothetical protein INS49_007280 [Diaporthe citri]|uniref:uncharacterized protein n=1 Tax=Diaporthe citri TaxID=83186 RepID=UPI001C7E3FE3|nr:uncharacterized protein INS49_007280 [Diaporthe citri]KAG6365669.1 hypothetical protein INS49_007280 [Diaporthe citri]